MKPTFPVASCGWGQSNSLASAAIALPLPVTTFAPPRANGLPVSLPNRCSFSGNESLDGYRHEVHARVKGVETDVGDGVSHACKDGHCIVAVYLPRQPMTQPGHVGHVGHGQAGQCPPELMAGWIASSEMPPRRFRDGACVGCESHVTCVAYVSSL